MLHLYNSEAYSTYTLCANESCHSIRVYILSIRVYTHILIHFVRMSRVILHVYTTCIHGQTCHTCKWVVSFSTYKLRVYMVRHVTHVNESCHSPRIHYVYTWSVKSHVWMSRVILDVYTTCIRGQTCHTCEWGVSNSTYTLCVNESGNTLFFFSRKNTYVHTCSERMYSMNQLRYTYIFAQKRKSRGMLSEAQYITCKIIGLFCRR